MSSLHLQLQKYKLERFFDLLDVDNNQKVDQADIVLWVEKAAGYMEEDGVSVSEEQKNQLFHHIKRICKFQLSLKIKNMHSCKAHFVISSLQSQCFDRVWGSWQK